MRQQGSSTRSAPATEWIHPVQLRRWRRDRAAGTRTAPRIPRPLAVAAASMTPTDAPTAEALLQQPILLLEVFDRIEMPAIDPAGKQR